MHDFVVGDIVERAVVLLFQAFAQILRSNKTSFAVGEVASGFVAKFDEGGVGKTNDAAGAINVELGIDGVTVAGGNGVPDVGEAAIVDVAAQF